MTTQLDADRSVVGRLRGSLRRDTIGVDFAASFVVFLVALPLCVGVAVASGVPVELGIVTGIVGGLVVGLLPGSTMQVSGPATGLTVAVADAVDQHGLATLGIIVLGAGLLQVLLGLSKLGPWFRAISPSVVQGMLGGIGLVLILGQIYPVGGLPQPGTTGEKFAGIPDLVVRTATSPTGLSGLGLAALTLVLIGAWNKAPAQARAVPGALVAVVAATAVAALTAAPVDKVEVGSLLAAINPPSAGAWGEFFAPAVLGSILTFALIASAESLFSAAAVDRMHDGPKTEYNKELIAQGAGNSICGLLGALPMTAVIVRSSANVQAGARTEASRVLHGAWLLLFVIALPGVLGFLPQAVLAALLIQAGWKLLELRGAVELARNSRGEGLVLVLTATMIVATDLLIGTLTGLAAAVIKTAIEMSRLSVRSEHEDELVRIELGGNATFLRLPQLLDHLEQVPAGKDVQVDMTSVRHLDHACHRAVSDWAAQQRRGDRTVEVAMPAGNR